MSLPNRPQNMLSCSIDILGPTFVHHLFSAERCSKLPIRTGHVPLRENLLSFDASLEAQRTITPTIVQSDKMVITELSYSSTESSNDQSESKIGWKPRVIIIVPYILAAIIASIHITFLEWLKGKETERISQIYVTTFSIIMTNTIGILLQLCLGYASTQYLWHLVRVNTYKTVLLDDLFSLRYNTLALLRVLLKKEAILLVASSVFIMVISVAISFPPGAISVKQARRTIEAAVPSFGHFDLLNASNDSIEGQSCSLYKVGNVSGMIQPEGLQCNSRQGQLCNLAPKSMSNLAEAVLLTGTRTETPSTCGAYCQYTLSFQGPYLQCTESSANTTVSYRDIRPYVSSWTNEDSDASPNFNFTVLRPISPPFEANNDISSVNVTETNTSCVPASAIYEVTNRYSNNIQTLEYNTNNVQPLFNPKNVCWPSAVKTLGDYSLPSNWTSLCTQNSTDVLSYFMQDSNNLGVIVAMSLFLHGEYNIGALMTLPNIPEYFVVASDDNNTNLIAASTALSVNLQGTHATKDNVFPDQLVNFVVTEDILNEMLANITLSAISLGKWQQKVIVTQNLTDTIYVISHPLSIYIPYGVLFLLAIPFLGLGLWSLHSNGVAAQNGGFLQLLLTTAGSRELHRLAGRSSGLGVDYDIPQELSDMKVMFGEFVDQNRRENFLHSVGFGGLSEVRPLQRLKQAGL